MAETVLGTRIRERRRQIGITQVDLAKQIGISPSYLNLIERNKRRIAGALLRQIADALEIGLEELDGAAERRLAETLIEIAHLPAMATLEIDGTSTGTFIARYPGWARAVAALALSEQKTQETVRLLSDRLTHDPFLGETVHLMQTRIAAIRSAGEILTAYSDIPAEQLARFHAIVHDEAERLTDVGESLATYFDKADETERNLTPQDEVEALFEANANHFADVETVVQALKTEITATAPADRLDAARAIAHRDLMPKLKVMVAAQPAIGTAVAAQRALEALLDYAAGAILMPLEAFNERAAEVRYDIEALAAGHGVPFQAVCQRLTALPQSSGAPTFGYLQANASGTILEMRAISGLVLPRFAGACPLWALFRAQQTPETVLHQRVLFPTGARFVFAARARNTAPPGYGQPRHYVTDMLAVTEAEAAATVYAPGPDVLVEEVGPACRQCPRTSCAHRVGDPLVD